MTPFYGQICMFGFNWAPVGWALCNGQLIAISSNPALFSLLGTTFGGDGVSTFGLPDLQGRVPVGQGSGAGLYPVRIGDKLGSNTERLTTNQIPTHHHGLASIGIGYNEEGPGTGSTLTNLAFNNEDAEETVALNATQTGNAGGGQAFSIMQPYLGLSFCIATDGIYPQRP